MAEQEYNIYQAKTLLSRLVARVARGEEIVIAKAGKPLAKLVPIPRRRRRQPGGWEGRVYIAEDFDAELPVSIQAGFEGGSEDD